MSQEIKICSADSGCFLGGLSATDTIASNNLVVACCGFKKLGGTSGQFLKADGSTDSASYTTCTGDVTGIDAGTAITVGDGTTSTPSVGVTTSCNSAWNAKTTCTGTTTPSNTQTFTNKSGSNSQWTNDAGYTTCTGTGVGNITCISTSAGLDGSGSSGTVNVSLDLSELTDMTAAVVPTTDEVILLDNGAERRKLFSEIFGSNAYTSTTIPTNNSQISNGCGYTTCTGTVVAGDISSFTSCTGTTTPSNTQTFTNKSGNISQWTNNSGYTTCTGDITGVTAGNGLSGGGSSGSVTLALDGDDLAGLNQSACAGINCVGDITNVGVSTGLAGGGSSGSVTLCINSTCNSTWNAKTTCTGTTTPSNTQTFTNKSGCITMWNNNAGYTTCTGTVVASDISGFYRLYWYSNRYCSR